MFFQSTAIVILLLFYGCYFIKMILQKKKGIETDQIGKGKTGRIKAIELTMKVATILVLLTEVLSIYRNASLNLCKTLKCFVFFIDYGNIIGNSKKGRQC